MKTATFASVIFNKLYPVTHMQFKTRQKVEVRETGFVVAQRGLKDTC